VAPSEPETIGSTVLTTYSAVSVAAHAGGPWGAGPGWLVLLIPLFWIAVIASLALVAVRMRRSALADGYGPRWAQPGRGAEATLAERFAQGDIDEKDYRARLKVLRANAYPQRTPRKA
jgi:putative membrane protein